MPIKTLRPSAEAFRRAGWLPASNKVYKEWMDDLTKRIRHMPLNAAEALLPPVLEFKNFIETDATVYQEFIRMFEGVTEAPTNHVELLYMINDIFRKAPYYGDLGPPMYMIMSRVMNTQGGFSAFTKENLDRHFKKLFETWTVFLASKDSRYVLVDGKFDDVHYGWFSPEAEAAMLVEFAPGRTFAQVFICEPNQQYYGFKSYDDFFNRMFRDIPTDRPITGGDEIIGAPCEATSYCVQDNLQRSDNLFIKDEAYSLVHLLANDPLLDNFIGGFAAQGFLNTTGYHRWHSPVTGSIVKIINVPGTYFAQAPSTIGDPDDPDGLPPYLKSLRYFSNTAARTLIFIRPDNADIGLLCFVGIGMTEISTCEATVYDNQRVVRGDETGMFHFGGSSFTLVFSKDTKAKIDGKFRTPGIPIKINEPFAAVSK